MTQERAGQLADQAWLKLTARAAVLLFSIVGSIGVPMIVGYFGKMSAGIDATREAIVGLREEVRVGQANDNGRLMDLDRRVAFLERRIERLEAGPASPSPAR